MAAYVGLTKPRVIELLLLTTVPVMFFAARGVPPLGLVVATVVGGTLLGRVGVGSSTASTTATSTSRCGAPAAGRCRATSSRRAAALVFGVVLGVLADGGAAGLGQLAVGGAVAGWPSAFYVFGYTMLLKRRTTQNIVWGGLAGCFPALIGWTAVTGELSWAPVVLFAVVFFWTPPHTWALALRYREDYADVDVPMLPGGGARPREVGRQIVALQLGDGRDLAAALAGRRHRAGSTRVAAAVLGAVFLVEAHRMWRRARRHRGPQRDPADAAVPLLEPLPVAALRRRRARPAAHPLTRA